MLRLLLVDDEPDILASFRFVLERGFPGATILTAASGEEGMQVLERGPVDVILSDYKMRGIDGLDFLQRARRLVPGVRCVLVTAYPEGDLAFHRLRDLGVTGLLPKPCTSQAMLQAVALASGDKAKVRGLTRAAGGGGAGHPAGSSGASRTRPGAAGGR